jgi:hypothetical protein
MDIREISEKFASDEQCLAYLQQIRWPDGIVRCPECGCKEIKRVDRSPDKRGRNTRKWFYLCGEKSCRNQFTPTSGTLFHDTHLPLIVWFHAVALVLNAKKGISAKQLQRDLKIGGYKTAWYLNHRIREAMNEGALPPLGGIVEIDETYLGARQKGHEGKLKNKEVVLGMRERGGPLRFIHTKDATAYTWKQIIESHLHEGVELVMTDESTAARIALKTKGMEDRHRMVKHSAKQYCGRNQLHELD